MPDLPRSFDGFENLLRKGVNPVTCKRMKLGSAIGDFFENAADMAFDFFKSTIPGFDAFMKLVGSKIFDLPIFSFINKYGSFHEMLEDVYHQVASGGAVTVGQEPGNLPPSTWWEMRVGMAWLKQFYLPTWQANPDKVDMAVGVYFWNNTPAPVVLYLLGSEPKSSATKILMEPGPDIGAPITDPTFAPAPRPDLQMLSVDPAVWQQFAMNPDGQSALGVDIGPCTVDGIDLPGGTYAMVNTAITDPINVGANTIITILQPTRGGLGFTYQLTMTFLRPGATLADSDMLISLSVRRDRLTVMHLGPSFVKTVQGLPAVYLTFTNTFNAIETAVQVGTVTDTEPVAWACLPEGMNLVRLHASCSSPDRCTLNLLGFPAPQGTIPLTTGKVSTTPDTVFMSNRIWAVPTPSRPTADQCVGLTCAGAACTGTSATMTLLFDYGLVESGPHIDQVEAAFCYDQNLAYPCSDYIKTLEDTDASAANICTTMKTACQKAADGKGDFYVAECNDLTTRHSAMCKQYDTCQVQNLYYPCDEHQIKHVGTVPVAVALAAAGVGSRTVTDTDTILAGVATGLAVVVLILILVAVGLVVVGLKTKTKTTTRQSPRSIQ